MNGLHFIVCIDMVVDNSYITESDYPFRVLFKRGKVEPVDYPNTAISTPRGKNCPYGVIIDEALKVSDA